MDLVSLSSQAPYTSTYVGVIALLFATSFGLPIPEEIILVLAGAASYHGAMAIPVLFLCAGAAVLLSDLALYSLGRLWGPALLRKRFFRFLLPPERARKFHHRHSQHMLRAVFYVRFISGLRAPTYFTVGMLRMPAHKFFLTDLVGTCLHVPLFIFVGYFFSPHVARIVAIVKNADRAMAVTVVLAITLLAVYIGYQVGIHRKKPAD